MAKNDLLKLETCPRKFAIAKNTRFDVNWLPAIQNLATLGYTDGEIGMILGYGGKDVSKWFANLKQNQDGVEEAVNAGRRMANTLLVAEMYRQAVGYDYTESEITYVYIPDDKNPGKTKRKKLKEKKVTKHKDGNAALSTLFATNKMGNDFVNKSEVHKKGININLSEKSSAEEIEKLAGKLLEVAERKKVESEPIDQD